MTFEKLQAENAELSRRLEEAEETIRAIQSGGVDAFVVEESEGRRVYTLEGADRHYRVLAEQMQQGAATLHLDGSIVYCNRRFAEMLNVPHEKLIGKTLDQYIAIEDRVIYDNLLWQGRTRSGRGEARLLQADGRLVPVYMTFNALQKDSGAAIGVLVTDLTTQKHHEQLTAVHNALRESEARYRMLFELGPVAVYSCDASGVIQDFNRRAAELWGRAPASGDTDEKFCGSFKMFRPDGTFMPHDQCPMADVLSGAMPHFDDGEVHIERPDSSRIVVVVTIRPLKNEHSEIIGAINCFYDITERNQQESLLRQYAADMAEADRRKDEFLATLAHELRNPLAPVRNAVQILHMKGPDVPELQWASEVIDRQVQHMTHLIEGLMDVSRINQGKIELKREWVELAKVVQGAVEVSRPLIEDNGHKLTVILPPRPLIIDADLTRLTQVFLNLLNNAAKYTEPGGRIDLVAEQQGSDVIVSTRDSGIGISADNLPKIFKMFSQVEGALSRSQGGLGIGLCLVKRLVEMHGGRIEAHSDGMGKGSEFVVRLPLVVEQTYHRRTSEENDKEMPTSSLRILVVDDNRDAASSVAMLLKIMGNDVRSAHDGEEAVTAAGEFKADVVLLDIGLPKLNGYEACRRIRAQSWGKNIVIIAVTGWGQDDDRRKSEEAGFDRHMVKPVDPKSLVKLLTELQTAKLQVDKTEQDSIVANDLDVGRKCVNLAGGP